MKHLTAILFVLLLIAGVIIYLLIRERSIAQRDQDLQSREFRNRQNESLSKIVAREDQIIDLLNERYEDSVRHAKDQGRLKAKIAALTPKSYNIRFVQVPAPDSTSSDTTFIIKEIVKITEWRNGVKGESVWTNDEVNWKDSVIVLQDSLIYSLENERDTLYITDNQVIDSLKKSNLELSELFKGQFKQTIRAENELRREKKKRIVLSLGVNYSPFGNQITPGVHLGWRIARF